MDDQLKAFAVTAGVTLLAFTVYQFVCGLIHWARTPRHIHESHRALRKAIVAMNVGSATPEQRARVNDAEKFGMVTGTFHIGRGGYQCVTYYVTRTANRYRAQGEYPTTGTIDAILEVYRIPTQGNPAA